MQMFKKYFLTIYSVQRIYGTLQREHTLIISLDMDDWRPNFIRRWNNCKHVMDIDATSKQFDILKW